MKDIDILAAIIELIKENEELRRRLEEQTDKHWSANMQIALYDDELRRIKNEQH